MTKLLRIMPAMIYTTGGVPTASALLLAASCVPILLVAMPSTSADDRTENDGGATDPEVAYAEAERKKIACRVAPAAPSPPPSAFINDAAAFAASMDPKDVTKETLHPTAAVVECVRDGVTDGPSASVHDVGRGSGAENISRSLMAAAEGPMPPFIVAIVTGAKRSVA